jgi:hypothetical protein
MSSSHSLSNISSQRGCHKLKLDDFYTFKLTDYRATQTLDRGRKPYPRDAEQPLARLKKGTGISWMRTRFMSVRGVSRRSAARRSLGNTHQLTQAAGLKS